MSVPRSRRADFEALPPAALSTIDLASLAGRTILITGATGFVGGWLLAAIDWLNERMTDPIRVYAISRRPDAAVAHWLTWLACDVRQLPRHAVADFVIHAALPSTATPVGGARELFAVAIDGTRAVLNHAVAMRARRVLLLSSGAVYGGPHAAAIAEGDFAGFDPLAPGSDYAAAKLGAEAAAAAYVKDNALEVSIARLFACIGPGYRAHPHLAHVSLLADALTKRSVRVRSAGQAVRSYLYGADTAVWLLAILASGTSGALNVGSDAPITIAEFARLVAYVAGLEPSAVELGREPDSAPSRSYFVPDIARARTTLGLAPWTSLERAVRRSLEDAAGSPLDGGRRPHESEIRI